MTKPVPQRPLVIAHRGASAIKPENTLAAFERALALGVDGIELDVQTTSDDVPVVFHDFTLRRLTGQSGRLRGSSLAALKTLRVRGTDEPIPTLKEVLALVRGRCVVQIELKRGVAVAPVVKAVIAARASKWVILASFELSLVAEAAKLAPRIPRMLISEGKGGAKKLIPQLPSLDAVGLSVNHAAIRDRAFVASIQATGATLWTWTVNDTARMRELALLGVDAILSDNPALAKKTLSRSLNRSRSLES
ncbi:glycerophosphodiester phosphodiesterase [Oleiharenicola lentus]|uniref:glycerophosphodiester phosphodiesterase n=1 Tax=Oleiharenicola lentus TaxID=2508720 RepID=UPI003F676162